MISFCWLCDRVCVLPSVVTLDQLPMASSLQLWLRDGLEIVSGTLSLFVSDRVPREKAPNWLKLS